MSTRPHHHVRSHLRHRLCGAPCASRSSPCSWRSRTSAALNTPIALTIAVTKATLVVIYFMGVRYNTPLTKVVVVAGFFWLLIMFGLGMSDYLTRPWIGVPGR